MKHPIGIIGGMGPMASQLFYKMVTEHTAAERDQDHIDLILLSDASMPDRTAAILSGQYEGPYEQLLSDARLLERCGCAAIAVTCNTAHFFADMIAGKIGIPILHMIRETAAALARRCPGGTAGILATDGTIQTRTYQKECIAQGFEGVAPDRETQRLVMSIIYDEIKKGEKGSREKFAAIDRSLRALGCDAAILGCTELSVYRVYHGLPDFYVDAMEVLVEQAITTCGKRLRTV